MYKNIILLVSLALLMGCSQKEVQVKKDTKVEKKVKIKQEPKVEKKVKVKQEAKVEQEVEVREEAKVEAIEETKTTEEDAFPEEFVPEHVRLSHIEVVPH